MPKAQSNRVRIHIMLNRELEEWLDGIILDPIYRKPRYGMRSQVMEKLLARYRKEVEQKRQEKREETSE